MLCSNALHSAGGPLDIGYECGSVWWVKVYFILFNVLSAPVCLRGPWMSPLLGEYSLRRAHVFSKLAISDRSTCSFTCILSYIIRWRRCLSNAQTDPRTNHPYSPGVAAFGHPDWYDLCKRFLFGLKVYVCSACAFSRPVSVRSHARMYLYVRTSLCSCKLKKKPHPNIDKNIMYIHTNVNTHTQKSHTHKLIPYEYINIYMYDSYIHTYTYA